MPAPRPGWFARWFGLNGRQPASFSRPPFPVSDHTPFTPEASPGLSPEARTFFNTPVEECDPEMLHATLSVLAVYISESMPPELGMDARELLSTLWGRLGPSAGDAPPDAPPATPAPPIQAQQMEPVDDAAITAFAASDATPETVAPTVSALRRDRPRFAGSRSPFGNRRSPRHRRRLPGDRCRLRLRGLLPEQPQRLPTRRLCYAACAGPP